MTSPSGRPRVFALHAHPDDIELQCAGTLLRLKDLGCELVVATMTPGDCGSAELGCDEIAAVRREEARAAARLLGAEYSCLEFRDLAIVHDNDSRRRVTEAVRRARPDIVITAPPVDYMSDHELTSRLVRDACFNASVPNYKTHQWDPAPPLEHIPYLYYVDPIQGIDWYGRPAQVDFIVDISDTIEQKLALLACHSSQREWLRRQHDVDEYLDQCRRWSAARGLQLGTRASAGTTQTPYGEGFTQHRGHPYPGDNLLLETLGGGSGASV